jgi:signal transduction histidine kinase
MAILVTHIACAIIPAICDGPSTLYGTWLVCGIVAFEIKRFEFAIMGPLLCALALPLGYWTGGIDYNPSIPVLACSYIGAFFVGFAIRWKIQTEQRKTDLAIAQEQVRRQQKRLKEIHILHDSIAGAMTYAILLCRKKEPSESSDTLPQIEQVLMQALHELRTQIISPMTDELKTDKEEDADELFQQHIEAQCKRLRILGFTGTPIIRGNLNAMDKSLLPSLQTVCTEILNNIAKHGKPGAFAFILSVGPDAVRIFASNLYNAAMNSAPENHYGTALIQDFAQQHNGTMTINSENEEWSLSLTIPLAHQVKLMFSPTEKL